MADARLASHTAGRRDPARRVEVLRAQLHARARRQRRPIEPVQAGFGHPQEFDESGFPIPQRVPSFAERVRRLVRG